MDVVDLERAAREWGANCGPAAIAEISGLTLDELRPHMDAFGFDRKRYTNPTMMFGVLDSIGCDAIRVVHMLHKA